MTAPAQTPAQAPAQAQSLSRHLARRARALRFDQLPSEAVAKVKIAFLDLLSCAYESLDLAPSRNAIRLAALGHGDAAVIGTDLRVPPGEAAFANAVLSHGLVREDMHTGSVSHLGVVIFPTLLALTHGRKVRGIDFVLAAVCGYETGAALGRALMDRETVRRFRPTGITGPLGAAMGGCIQSGLSEDAMVSALGLAANATAGFNEWPETGADDMFFHAGFAARNAVTCVELAEAGAYASEHALDGAAGLFAALGRQERSADVRAFADAQALEILAVYHKPAPACNYAQTACQVARALVAEEGVRASEIEAIVVRVSAAALNYPGCNAAGPFERVLQAKMSIRYCVAATLIRGAIEESNYRMLNDPEVLRLIGVTSLEEAPEFTQAYPARQGTEVMVKLRDGRTVRRRMQDLIPATETEIRTRFRAACSKVLSADRAIEIEQLVDRLEQMQELGALDALLGRRHG